MKEFGSPMALFEAPTFSDKVPKGESSILRTSRVRLGTLKELFACNIEPLSIGVVFDVGWRAPPQKTKGEGVKRERGLDSQPRLQGDSAQP